MAWLEAAPQAQVQARAGVVGAGEGLDVLQGDRFQAALRAQHWRRQRPRIHACLQGHLAQLLVVVGLEAHLEGVLLLGLEAAEILGLEARLAELFQHQLQSLGGLEPGHIQREAGAFLVHQTPQPPASGAVGLGQLRQAALLGGRIADE